MTIKSGRPELRELLACVTRKTICGWLGLEFNVNTRQWLHYRMKGRYDFTDQEIAMIKAGAKRFAARIKRIANYNESEK